MSAEYTINVYPACYLKIWNVLVIPTPIKSYDDRVLSVLAAMEEFKLVKITPEGMLVRNEFPDSDFLEQAEKIKINMQQETVVL